MFFSFLRKVFFRVVELLLVLCENARAAKRNISLRIGASQPSQLTNRLTVVSILDRIRTTKDQYVGIPCTIMFLTMPDL